MVPLERAWCCQHLLWCGSGVQEKTQQHLRQRRKQEGSVLVFLRWCICLSIHVLLEMLIQEKTSGWLVGSLEPEVGGSAYPGLLHFACFLALRSWEQTLNPMKWEWTRETEAFSSSSLPPILPPSFRRLSLSEKDKEWRISSEKCHCPHMPRTPWHEIQSHSS